MAAALVMFNKAQLKLFLLSLSFLCFSVTSLAEVAIEKDLELFNMVKGSYQDIKMKDLPDRSLFKFENEKFRKYVDIVYDDDRKVMRFKPKKKGSTTIRFVDAKDSDKIIKQIKLVIQESDLQKVSEEIKLLLGEIEGIEIRILNNKVYVDGFVLLPKDFNRIGAVLAEYKGKAVSLVRISPLAKKKIAERIEAEIDNPQIYVEVINDFYILEGQESYPDEAKRAVEIAQAHISDLVEGYAIKGEAPAGQKIQPLVKGNPIINNIQSFKAAPDKPKKIIQVIAHYVELQKSYKRGFDFQWAPTISAETGISFDANLRGGGSTVASIAGIISNLLPKLNWAKEHGHARVLDSLSIITEEGNRGYISNDRVIPYAITNQQGLAVPDRVPVKIDLGVTPTIAGGRSDSIKMDLEINIGEVLELTANGPSTTTNKLKTIVTVRSSQSAALGGLLKSNSGTAYNRQPAGTTAPLFRLGASKDLARSQSQFVIFITPYIKASASQGVNKVKRKFRLDR